jgi:excisionase family DNA binding protein
MRTDETSHLLSPRDVARELNVSMSTVRRLVADGRLPAYRVGHQVRFDPGEMRDSLRPVAIGKGDH